MSSRNVRSANSTLNQSNGNTSAFECPVCCTLYQLPKGLPCGHTICSPCCQQLWENRGVLVIECPMCRQVSRIPEEGLPTIFALQDAVNQYSASRGVESKKPYKCVECKRPCGVDEAWLCRRPECIRIHNSTSILLCSHCVITRHADHGGGKGSKDLESLSETLLQYDALLNSLKQEVEACADKQRDWNGQVKKSVEKVETCVSDVDEACKRLARSVMNDVKLVEKEISTMRHTTSALNPANYHYEGLSDLQKAVQDIEKKLKYVEGIRQGSIMRMDNALESLRIGLDCLLKIEHEENNEIKAMEKTRPDSKPALAPIPHPHPVPHSNPHAILNPKPILNPKRSKSPASHQLNFLDNDFLADADDDGARTPPRHQQPPHPRYLANITRQKPKENTVAKLHDTTAPVANSSTLNFNLNLNQSHFSVPGLPQAFSSPMVEEPSRFGSTTRRGHRSGTGANSSASAAGSDFRKSRDRQFFRYSKESSNR